MWEMEPIANVFAPYIMGAGLMMLRMTSMLAVGPGFAVGTVPNRIRVMVAVGFTIVMDMGLGGVVAVLSTIMTWGTGAGLFSSHSREVDIDLAGQSFNGYQASGGSWSGIIVLFLGFFAVMAAGSCLIWTGGIGRLRGPGGLVAVAIGAFAAIYAFPILGEFDGYTTLANLQGHEAQAVWAVAVEVITIPALLGLVLGLARVSVPLNWRTVGAWAFTAGILGHYF